MKAPIKVFIVDDHPMVVEGLSSMLSHESSIELVGHASNASSCLGYFVQHEADVVLMDINLPDKSGIELCRDLLHRFPSLKVLAISSFNQGSHIREMMEQGASGYVLKNVLREELVEGIHAVVKGKQYLSQEAGFAMIEEKKRAARLPVLTKREKEVLMLIAEGLTNPQMAERLFISLSTVESHRKSIMAKIQATNTASLLKRASENGLLK